MNTYLNTIDCIGMDKKRFLLVNIMFFLLVHGVVYAQEKIKVQDIGAWIGAGVDYRFAGQYTLNFTQDIRLFNSFTTVNKTNTELGLQYKINKNFAIGGAVRYIIDQKSDKIYTQDLRYNFDLQFKIKPIKKFQLSYRIRIQQKHENIAPTTFARQQQSIANWRNRIKFSYRHRKHKTYITTELFRQFMIYRRPYFNKIRLVVGNKMTTKLGDIDIGLAYERELSTRFPLNFFFLKLSYTFSFEHK
jgi:hypothetical protein